MKTLCRGLLVFFVAFSVGVPRSFPAEPKGGDYQELKVLRVFSAKEDDHIYRAFLVEWKGQEVIAMDVASQVLARSDRLINVLVVRGPNIHSPEGHGHLSFLARPQKKPPFQRSQILPVPPPATLPPVLDLRVLKVYTAQDGDHRFRAYVVEWQGQEVVVQDVGARTIYEEGSIVRVMVNKRPFPDGSQPYGILSFSLMPELPTRAKRR